MIGKNILTNKCLKRNSHLMFVRDIAYENPRQIHSGSPGSLRKEGELAEQSDLCLERTWSTQTVSKRSFSSRPHQLFPRVFVFHSHHDRLFSSVAQAHCR